MPTIQSLGMSGLPLDSLLTSLQNNENLALQAIQNRQTAAQAKLSAYGKLQAAVSAFQVAAQVVAKSDSYGAITSAAGSDAISATTTTTAIPGQYAIQVDQLATSQTLVFDGRGDRTTAIGADGTLSITTADGKTHTLDLTGGDTSLNGLVKAINAKTDIGVNATIVNDGGASPYRLLLTSRATGTQAAVSEISVAGNADLQAFLGTSITVDASGSTSSNPAIQVQAAQDATLSVNGIAITSHTNTVDNVIDGVTLSLNKVTTTATSLTLSRDNSVAKKAITDFVSAYNTLQSTMKSLTAFDVDSQTSSVLTGDSVARSVQTRMQGALTGAIDSTTGTTLASIGITTDPTTGQLKVDQTKLDKALSGNMNGVKSLLTGSTGIGTRVGAAADTFTRSGGIFSTTTDGLNKTIADIKKQYDATSSLIDQRMATYRTQFTQLDSMVTQMNSLSSYLTQQLTALNGTKNSK
jgi:flagellar hook-associated protein 2